MKIKILFKLAIVLLISLFPYLSYGQIKKNIDLKTNDIIRNSTNKNGVLYDCIQLKNAVHQQSIGDPDLPVYYYTFYVPMNEMAIDVTLKSNKQDVILLTNDLIPSQSPIPTGFDDQDTTFNLPNKLVYKSDNIYPTIQARICQTDYLDGDLKLVTVEVYPMQYYPKSKKIIYSNQFELKFETRKDDNSNGKKFIQKNVIKKS